MIPSAPKQAAIASEMSSNDRMEIPESEAIRILSSSFINSFPKCASGLNELLGASLKPRILPCAIPESADKDVMKGKDRLGDGSANCRAKVSTHVFCAGGAADIS